MNPKMIRDHLREVCKDSHIMIVHKEYKLISQKESYPENHSRQSQIVFSHNIKFAVLGPKDIEHIDVKLIYDLKFKSVKSN